MVWNVQVELQISTRGVCCTPQIDAPPFAGFAATNPTLPPVPARDFLTTRQDYEGFVHDFM